MSSETASNNLFGWEEKRLLRHKDGIMGVKSTEWMRGEMRDPLRKRQHLAQMSRDTDKYCWCVQKKKNKVMIHEQGCLALQWNSQRKVCKTSLTNHFIRCW